MGETVLIRAGRRSALALALLLTAGRRLPAQSVLVTDESPEAAEGQAPTVAAIEIRSDAPLAHEREVERLLDLAVGEPFSGAHIRRTLRNFAASGISQVEIYSRPAGDGAGVGGPVVAVIVLRPPVLVDQVILTGELGLSRSDLTAALEQGAGQPLSEDHVLRGVNRLQEIYHDQGYFDAQVHLRVATDAVRRLATITYEVAAGARSNVLSIDFEGPIAPFTAATLIEHLRIKPNAPYRKRTVEADADRLQRWLVGQGHNLARVDDARDEVAPGEPTGPAGTTAPAGQGVRLTFPIDVGPKLEVQTVGVPLDRLRKKDLVPFLGEGGYDEALVLQSLQRIKDSYQQQGYYHVRVDSSEERQDGTLRLTLTVDPGREYTLKEVDFKGNAGVSDDRLRELMEVSEKRLLALGSGRLVQSALDKDLDNIRSYYALEGYGQAKVGPSQVLESGDTLRLVIPVEEGPRLQVGKLELRGLDPLDLSAVRRKLPLEAGGPFHPTLLETAVDTVRAAFAEKGYADAQVSAVQAWNADHSAVDLTLEAIPGPQAVVGRVIVRGNQRTESEVIRRALPVDQGKPVSDTTLLEAERSLYRLGIFSRVDVDLTRAGLASTTRDVVIRVEEGKPRRLTYGLGYDTEIGPRGLLGFTHDNVAGRAYRFVTDLQVSRTDQRARVVFDQPYLGPFPVALTSSLFYLDESKEVVGARIRRWGGRSEASKVIGHTRYGLAYDYRVVRAELEDGVALNDLERQNQPLQISSIIPSVLLDYRDDPLLPSRGWSSLLQTQYSFPALGSHAEFLKIFLQQTQYLRLSRVGVLAASLRLGGIQPFQTLDGKIPGSEELPNTNVFIDERFFAGGRTTHRAYGRDELGIPGQTLLPREEGSTDFRPVGGNGLALANVEFRFPIAGPVGGSVFYDLGNVWADWRDIDVHDLKGGVGLGLRYISPIGPIRVEAGWKLDRESFEGARPVVFLSFGNPF